MPVCNFCRKTYSIEGKIRRTEVCVHCGGDLHCCLNCRFHDPAAHNQCREPQAEWTSIKEKANFCDYFSPSDRMPVGGGGPPAARETFDSLFKKSDEL